MPISVRTKGIKKQSSLSGARAVPVSDKDFENSLLSLEDACIVVLENRFTGIKDKTERRYWQHRFVNIANPVSLALMEYKGPRHFHYHYRHRKDDETVLHPILENPVETLAKVCKSALKQCQSQLVGVQDDGLLEVRDILEGALRGFLYRYREYCKQVRQ